MPLPIGSHSVRICPVATLGDNDEVVFTCFVPHAGNDLRAADRYLSVHWLEYLGRGPFPDCLQRLRTYLFNSPFPREFKPTLKGRLAVLCCQTISDEADQQIGLRINFEHMPRGEDAVATSIEITPDGQIQFGMASEQAAQQGLVLDPHCGLFTLPEEAAYQLAVQQFLASNVIHVESGKLPN